MQIKIEDATATQIADYAVKFHGMDVRPTMGKDKLITALRVAGFSGAEIEVEMPQPKGETPEAITARSPRDEPKRRIFIEQQEGAEGQRPVFASVNGSAMLIPRGVEVVVPQKYVGVLNNAQREVIDPDPGPMGGTLPPRRVLQYPFRDLGPA